MLVKPDDLTWLRPFSMKLMRIENSRQDLSLQRFRSPSDAGGNEKRGTKEEERSKKKGGMRREEQEEENKGRWEQERRGRNR